MSTAPAVPARSSIPTPLWPIGLAACAVIVIAAATIGSQGTGSEGLQILNRFLALPVVRVAARWKGREA